MINWYESHSTAKPKEVDFNASPNVVFIRRNITEEKIDEGYGEYTLYTYEEAKVSAIEYAGLITEKVAELTPYKETKTAYIEDTEITFTSVPTGNLSVFVVDADNNYPAYTLERQANTLKVSFEPCKTMTTVTISII